MNDVIKKSLLYVLGFFVIVLGGGFLVSKLPAQSARYVPIERYEFKQDAVVCYRTTYGTQGVALSCLWERR